MIRRALAHHAEQTHQVAGRLAPAPAPGYRAESLDVPMFKMLKHQIFGCANFDLLRTRVLTVN